MLGHHTITGPTGSTVHYRRGGSGAPLLFVHGALGLHRTDPFLEALSSGFDVIAPHLPGWGPARDDLDDTDAGPLDLVLTIVDLLDGLGLRSVDIVGESIGGWVAAEVAAIAPDRVERLVLVNPLGLWQADAPGVDPFASSPMAPSASLFADPRDRQRLVVGSASPTPEEEIEVLVTELMSLRAAARFLFPIPDTGVGKRLPRIVAPTTIVGGAVDRVVPAGQRSAWQSAIRGARAEVLDGVGHLVSLEAPDVLAASVVGLLVTSPV